MRPLLVIAAAVSLADTAAAQAPPTVAPLEHLRIVAPAAPGGGWDLTARVMQQVVLAEGLARVVQVENIAGAAGTIGLARFIKGTRRDEAALLVTGLVMQSAIVANQAPVSLGRVTPIARLTGEYEVIVVPAASPFRTLADLVAAFERDPGSVSWAGGSAGGTDQLLVALLARAVGVSSSRANYIAFAGGGESLAALVARMRESRVWRDALARRDWMDLYLPPDAFETFLEREQARVESIILSLRSGTDVAPLARTGASVFPAIVGAGLLVIGLALVLETRRARARGETSPVAASVPGNRRGLVWLAAGAVASLATLESTGFVVSSTILFWFTARGFGSARWLRDLAIGLALALAAFQQYGLQPGPLLFTTQPALVWSLIASLYIGNVMLLVLNLPLVGIWVRLLRTPRPLLFGGILVLATLGAYSLSGSLVDLVVLYGVGAIGCLMRIHGFPLAPAVIGLMLGPMAEQQFRRALAISQGDLAVFVTRPMSAALLVLTVVLLVSPALWRRRRVADVGHAR
jgi:tripartite-type tricarboxylate transporter receptor subunit TctC